MEDARDSYGLIYQVVREANVSGIIAPGLRGRMYKAIDTLKLFKAPADHISIAERISVTLHALEWAMFRCDSQRVAADWQVMRSLEEQWLAAPVPQP